MNICKKFKQILNYNFFNTKSVIYFKYNNKNINLIFILSNFTEITFIKIICEIL